MEIGIGLSQEKKSVLAAQEAARLAKAHIKGKADIAFIFGTNDLVPGNMLKAVSEVLGEIPIMGASASAIICGDQILTHGLLVLLLGIGEGVHFNTAHTKDIATKTLLAGQQMGEGLLYGLEGVPRSFSMIISDKFIDESSSFFFGLREKLGRSFPLVGATTTDDPVLKSHVYINHEGCKDACSGILWGGKLNFGLGIKHGWKPLGKPHIITEAKDNLVARIDDAPAAKLYQDYLGCDLAKLKSDLRQVSVLYPIGTYIPGEDEYLLRNILSVQEDGSIYFKGTVPLGSTVRLMIGTKETCLAAAAQAAQEAKKNLFPNSLAEEKSKREGFKKFAFVFNSISRYILLKRDAAKELAVVKEVLGADTPIVGVYTQGELAPLRTTSYRGEVYFHNQAIAILLIGE